MDTIDRDNAISVAKELWPDVDFSTIKIRYIPDWIPEFVDRNNIPVMPGAPTIVNEEEVELIEYGRYLVGYSSQQNVLFIGLWSEV